MLNIKRENELIVECYISSILGEKNSVIASRDEVFSRLIKRFKDIKSVIRLNDASGEYGDVVDGLYIGNEVTRDASALLVYNCMDVNVPQDLDYEEWSEDDEDDEDDEEFDFSVPDAILSKKIRSVIEPVGWRIRSFEHDYLMLGDIYGVISIIIEPDEDEIYDTRHQEFYHITLKPLLPKIKKEGLIPQRSTRTVLRSYINNLFLFDKQILKKHPDNFDLFINMVRSLQATGVSAGIDGGIEFDSESEREDIVLLKVFIPLDIEKYQDEDALGGFYIKQNIPKENIQVVYIGSIDELTIEDFQ